MNAFEVVDDLRIGSIIEVAGSSIRIELDGGITELTRTYAGDVYHIGQYASIIKIHCGRLVLVAYVRLLRMRSEIAREQGLPIPSGAEDARILEADLFGECVFNADSGSLQFARGVTYYPLPGQSAYLVTQKELRHIYQGVELTRDDGLSPMIPIGSYVGAAGSLCYANIDRMFGLHCAVLGSTGSGKSASVAALLHALIDHCPHQDKTDRLRPRIIIIDPHGEYAKAFGDKCAVFRAYDLPADAGEQDSRLLKLPYWLMSGEEFRDLVIGKTEYEATSENNIVYKALRHSRLVRRGWIEASRRWVDEAVDSSALPDDPRALDDVVVSKIAQYNSDTPDPFSLDELSNHISLEQGVKVDRYKKWVSLSTSESKSHASVLSKLAVLRQDPRLAFMMSNYADGDPDLPEILQQFVGDIDDNGRKLDLRIVDISGLPNEVAGPLTAAICRLLFQYKVWQTRPERERDPVLLICEEAHRYVPNVGLAEYQSAQKAIRRLAKEGRKYGIGLMLVSQRPADVERTVLSQCNTWIVMRLTNATDQEQVSRFLPDNLSGLSRLLPSLSRQEALFVGEAAAIPARIRIRDLSSDQLPGSDNVSFVAGWSRPPVDLATLEVVVARWRKDEDQNGAPADP